MPLKIVVLRSLLVPLLTLPGIGRGPTRAPAQLQLTLATLHAAALTSPRTSTDAADEPYLLVSMLGPGAATATLHLPQSDHLTIHLDEALGTRPLLTLSLQPGDSIRLLLSVLEAPQVHLPEEARAASAAATVLTQLPSARAALLTPALAPLIEGGAHWMGSAAVLVTNEAGTLYWRSLECVATCRVLTAPASSGALAASAAPLGGVVELSGSGGTYHLNLQGQRAS